MHSRPFSETLRSVRPRCALYNHQERDTSARDPSSKKKGPETHRSGTDCHASDIFKILPEKKKSAPGFLAQTPIGNAYYKWDGTVRCALPIAEVSPNNYGVTTYNWKRKSAFYTKRHFQEAQECPRTNIRHLPASLTLDRLLYCTQFHELGALTKDLASRMLV